MRYLGGKYRLAKYLAEAVNRYRQPGQLVWDAFCGGLSMSVALSKKGPVWSTDACVPLISLYQAVQNGWDPPTDVSLEEYNAAKALPDSDPMKAFCGFGCSFGGKWFGGLARVHASRPNTPPSKSTRAFLKALPSLSVGLVDFLAVEPRPTAALLYLDPPYAGVTQYAAAPPFDHSKFVERVRGWARHAHVFVSEYAFPIGECVWERSAPLQACFRPGAVERLYHLHSGNV